MKNCQKKLKENEIVEKASGNASNLECVLPEDIAAEALPLVEVYVGTIPEKKFIRNAIIDLNRVLPVSVLQHLKRVKEDQIIICCTSEGSEYEVLACLSKLGFDLKLIKSQLKVISVTNCPPKTRKQFLFSNKLWPTNFHEDKYLESLVSNTVFSNSEIKEHEKWMRMAIEAAKRSKTRSGTVIIEPSKNELIAVASDSRNEHPLKHSVMVAVDLVARAQGGGAWDAHPADFFSKTLISECNRNSEDTPYLCTGYYVYTTREPCTMCAMALVHSRVKRVFYGIFSQNGALGSLQKIHTVRNLNHHYEVFKGLLQNEISILA